MSFRKLPFWKRVVFAGGLFTILLLLMDVVFKFSTTGNFTFISELFRDKEKYTHYFLLKIAGFFLYGIAIAILTRKSKKNKNEKI